jgi:hypothetical protein
MTLLDTVAGVVFVGTPHQGSILATVADKLRLILRTNPQVTNMVSDDAWLKLLNNQFRNLQNMHWTSPAFVDKFQLPVRSCSNACGLSWSR